MKWLMLFMILSGCTTVHKNNFIYVDVSGTVCIEVAPTGGDLLTLPPVAPTGLVVS